MLLALTLAFASVASPAAPRVLVLDVTGDTELAAGATKLVTTALERANRFDVVAGDDVRRALQLEAARQEAGCDATSCLDEIADAMGAQLVVFGDVTRVGDASLLTLNLFDTAAVRSIARASGEFRAGGLDDVSARLVRRLVREYDAAHGALPTGTIPIIAGSGGAVAGLALVAVGVWQLALLGEDQARHDRLVDDFTRDGDKALINDAQQVQRDAGEHGMTATLALTAGALLTTAGAVGVGYGVWSAVE